MLSFAHIINPANVSADSDLFVAQPVTFASMRGAAQAAAVGQVTVVQYAVGFSEDEIPEGFVGLPPLTRSVLNLATFQEPRPLPLLRDILDALFEASGADYFIYTNVDIGLQPTFYTQVIEFITGGYDSFVINRRTISGRYGSPDQLPEMLAESGKPHPGWDCFVFPRAIYPRFKLGDVCLGAGRVGMALLANMVAYSGKFREFSDMHLTFHIGDDRAWRNPAFADYDSHNTRELTALLAAIEAEVGPFPRSSIPGRFLWKKRMFGRLYDWWSRR